jgi:hypothetical protein
VIEAGRHAGSRGEPNKITIRSSEHTFDFFIAVGAFVDVTLPVVEECGGVEPLAAEAESHEHGDGAVHGSAEQEHVSDAGGADGGDAGDDDMLHDFRSRFGNGADRASGPAGRVFCIAGFVVVHFIELIVEIPEARRRGDGIVAYGGGRGGGGIGGGGCDDGVSRRLRRRGRVHAVDGRGNGGDVVAIDGWL